MTQTLHSLISFVIPVHNESQGLEAFHTSLLGVVNNLDQPYEILYVDDGSLDDTAAIVAQLHKKQNTTRLIKLSRNFGKEAALTAGISQASGAAIIMLDGDGQHPVGLIPNFIHEWEKGAQVVVGLRTNPSGKGMMKNTGPKLFYKLFHIVTGQHAQPGSSDFRLITKVVQKAFLNLPESDRVTRNLIDWVGFKKAYIQFKAEDRQAGEAVYSNRQLLKLATNSFVSSSPRPLYMFGYLGIIITTISFVLGLAILIEQLILDDPLNWNFTGTAMLGVLILFLIGLVLLSQGILSLYISHIHTQSKQRPLYIIDDSSSEE